MQKISPCLWFDKEAEEAAAFDKLRVRALFQSSS